MRIAAGSASFLIKVKSNRGEPINDQADDVVRDKEEKEAIRESREQAQQQAIQQQQEAQEAENMNKMAPILNQG